MKKIILGISLLSFASINSFAQKDNIKSLEIGANLPSSEELLSVSGNKYNLENVKTENGLLVMFSCNTCPFVIKSQHRTIEMMKYAKEHGIGMIIVNSNQAQRDAQDSYEEMKKYAEVQQYEVPYVVDEGSVLADKFGATHTPEVFLFDGTGTLQYKGAMEDNPANPSDSKILYLQNAMQRLVKGEKIDPNTTKSIGCSIKRM